MAQIAADNNDNRRAVRYYNEILQKYIEDKKTSEVETMLTCTHSLV